MKNYDPQSFESSWQDYWERERTFMCARNPDRPKFYILDMFPYPSGTGLHVGHPKGYVASDIVARFKKMCGYEVLHPMGWDSFGLPTERQAEKEAIHPADLTARNVARFKTQLKSIGLGYDWDRELATTDPSFFRWTQWIFLKLLEKGLAYQTEVAVNWCPALKTVLANEEVRDGIYIETGDPVERRLMKQWMLKITAYADKLLDDLDNLDWPDSLKELQRNWIGRSVGARIQFKSTVETTEIDVFTTRPDTLFGGTFCVLAPEHAMVEAMTTPCCSDAVRQYLVEVGNKSERDRISQGTDKAGVFTGSYVVNPATGKPIPVWISDYVLAHFGTGAVFACPAHDERDFEFAKKYGLDVVKVIEGDGGAGAYEGDGVHINSQFLDGLTTTEAQAKMITWLETTGNGCSHVSYKLRDWLFSRQRSWGEPIPVYYAADGTLIPEEYEHLPIKLPHTIPKSQDGDMIPLSAATDWVNFNRGGVNYRREVNTMPQWAGSSWYFLRFLDPSNASELCDLVLEKYWMPVDLYVGGAEHATLHLLYARFWHKFLYDIGVVSTKEPFKRLFNQGMVHSRSYRDQRGKYRYIEEVREEAGRWYLRDSEEEVETKIEKMSKSRCNGIPPEVVINEYSADSLRLYEVFMGPLEDNCVWSTDGVKGVHRFLEKAWKLYAEELALGNKVLSRDLERLLHQTIKRLTTAIEELSLNTAVSDLMILVNEARKRGPVNKEFLHILARLINPFAPHFAEEVWHSYLGESGSINCAKWPEYEEALTQEEIVSIAVQINGKTRSSIEVPLHSDQEHISLLAKKDDKTRVFLGDAQILREIYVPNRVINFVVRGT